MTTPEKLEAYTHFIAEVTTQTLACLLRSRRDTITITANYIEGSLKDEADFGGLLALLSAKWAIFGQDTKRQYEICLKNAAHHAIGEDWVNGRANCAELTFIEYLTVISKAFSSFLE